MGRAPCCSKVGLRRGPWSIKEDTILTNYIQEHGEGQWRSLPKNSGLLRCGKSCRLRWMNYLRPGIKRGDISEDEEDLIIRLHKLLGNRWSLIAGRLPGRTDNEIKNYWNTHLIKKLKKAGLNPPKPQKETTKTAKPTAAANKKKQKKTKKTNANTEKLPSEANATKMVESEQKVYLPKPIRVSSSVSSRTNSYDSLVSGSSSSDGDVAAAMEGWPPLLELGDDFMGVGLVMPVVRENQSEDSMSSDVNMWEKVYEEYFQLL